MASTAYAYRWDEAPAEVLDTPDLRLERRPTLASVQTGHGSWHDRQNSRLIETFGETAAPAEKLPLMLRVSIVLGGGLLGWAAPIAIAWSLVR